MKAVIMAGGQGTRFWPLSRKRLPKQFLQIAGEQTMLQETAGRLRPLFDPQDVYVVCSHEYSLEVRSQLPDLADDQVIIEPVPRSTAPCIGLAAVRLRRRFPDEVMAVLPADHVISDLEEFHRVLGGARELAKDGWLVTFGIEPSHPASGYGYVMRGESLGEFLGCAAHRVASFTEKPSRQRAEEFLKHGSYYWNSGMFMWSIDGILAEIDNHMPELGEALRRLEQLEPQSSEAVELYSQLSSVSVDYGVMEKSHKVAMFPCRLGWNDVGNWRALEQVQGRDSRGITTSDPHLNIDSRDCILVTSDGKLGVLVGVENLVVVETPDAVLVCARDRTEDVKKVVAMLEEKGWKKYL